MNRIRNTFQKLKKTGEKAFIVYLTSGYPDIETTEKLVLEMADRGVTMVELGVPFSDPIADGAIIQEASYKALLNGINLEQIFLTVRRLRKSTQIPLIFMTYYNPVYQYGLEKFARKAAGAGVDGIIVPDLPPEESEDLGIYLRKHGLSLIFLLASNSPPDRMKLIAKKSDGFIYCLAHIGITGTRATLEQGLRRFLKKTAAVADKPFVVGFGISRPEQVRKIAGWADGVVVGSAIIEAIRRNAGKKNMVKRVGGYVSKLMGGHRGPPLRKKEIPI